MDKICPVCLQFNEVGAVTCIKCSLDLTNISCCHRCGATRFSFAAFCYHCGIALTTPEHPSTILNSSASFDPTLGTIQVEIDEELATTFHGKGIRLFHSATTTFLDLPGLMKAIVIGKGRGEFQPHIDLRHFSQSEFISRAHAQISRREKQYYLEDLGSKNGTEINGVLLPTGRSQVLNFGDEIRLGGSDAFTFIFVKDQPINMGHLRMISGGDNTFEAELLASYVSSVTNLIEVLTLAIQVQNFIDIKYLGNQIAIASYNVGADVMHLLGQQLEDQAQQNVISACEKTQTVLSETLSQIRLFLKVFYGS